MSAIHSSAIVDPQAKIGDGVEIGPFCVVGANVELCAGAKLHSHVVVECHTRVGARTTIFPFASIGHQPQDLKFKGEPSRLEIGEDTVIREHVTMNPGTVGGVRQRRPRWIRQLDHAHRHERHLGSDTKRDLPGDERCAAHHFL